VNKIALRVLPFIKTKFYVPLAFIKPFFLNVRHKNRN
jgi:hypothetical protein